MYYDNYTGQVVRLYGRNAVLATTWENLSEQSTLIDYSNVNATAAKVQISSSSTADTAAGTGAQQVAICGIDANYKLQIETIALNGQTQVETIGSFLRVFSVEVVLSGTGKTNAGTIYTIKTGTGGTMTAGVPGTVTSQWCQMLIGYGVCTSGMFTVPAGRKYHILSGWAAAVAQISHIGLFTYNPLSNTLMNNFSSIVGTGASVTMTTEEPVNAIYPEKTDIYLRGLSLTAGGNANATLFFKWDSGA
jgi:hypothetical protein